MSGQVNLLTTEDQDDLDDKHDDGSACYLESVPLVTLSWSRPRGGYDLGQKGKQRTASCESQKDDFVGY